MNGVPTQIATIVAQRLSEAQERIAQGRQQIQAYVTSLPESLQQIGQEAAQEIQGQFEQLEQSVDDKQNQLVDDLSQQYADTLQQVDTRIEEMHSENRGLIDQAKDLVGGAISTIIEIKNMLTGALSGAAEAISSIIRDPIGFLSNLISGVKQGLQNFIGNVAEHLQTGLVGWLTGAMGSMGLEIPEDLFSLKGICSLVTRTWA